MVLPIHPVAKSFLMPGSGERDLGYHKSSKFFIILKLCYLQLAIPL